jgi:hypothetical protein
MEPIIAKCGYRCDLCPAYKANLRSYFDKQRMSQALSKYYHIELPVEQIRSCLGCQFANESPDKECPVFPCAREKDLPTCGHCPDFGCDKLKQRMDVVEQCLAQQSEVPQEDFDLYFKPYLSRTLLTEINKSLH